MSFFKLFLPFLIVLIYWAETSSSVVLQSQQSFTDKPDKTFSSVMNFYKPKTFRNPILGEFWASTWEGKPIQISVLELEPNKLLRLQFEGIPGISPYEVKLEINPTESGSVVDFQESYTVTNWKTKFLNLFFLKWEDRFPVLLSNR